MCRPKPILSLPAHGLSIEKTMAALALAFAWAHRVDWRHTQKPIEAKKRGRLAMPYFQYGLIWIRQAGLAGALGIDRSLHAVSMLIEAFSRIRFPSPNGLL